MDDPTVFKFSSSVIALPFVVAAIGAVASVVFWRKELYRFAGVSLFVALVAGLAFGPNMAIDRVVVSNEKVEQTTGFFFAPTVKGFRYADVAFVRVTQKPTGYRGRMNEVWEIHHVSGRTSDLDLGDLWETNSAEIIAILKTHGVIFVVGNR